MSYTYIISSRRYEYMRGVYAFIIYIPRAVYMLQFHLQYSYCCCIYDMEHDMLMQQHIEQKERGAAAMYSISIL